MVMTTAIKPPFATWPCNSIPILRWKQSLWLLANTTGASPKLYHGDVAAQVQHSKHNTQISNRSAQAFQQAVWGKHNCFIAMLQQWRPAGWEHVYMHIQSPEDENPHILRTLPWHNLHHHSVIWGQGLHVSYNTLLPHVRCLRHCSCQMVMGWKYESGN